MSRRYRATSTTVAPHCDCCALDVRCCLLSFCPRCVFLLRLLSLLSIARDNGLLVVVRAFDGWASSFRIFLFFTNRFVFSPFPPFPLCHPNFVCRCSAACCRPVPGHGFRHRRHALEERVSLHTTSLLSECCVAISLQVSLQERQLHAVLHRARLRKFELSTSWAAREAVDELAPSFAVLLLTH